MRGRENTGTKTTMTRPEEEEDWTFISPEPSPEHVRNEQTQTEEVSDSDIDVLERFDVGATAETESIVSDFSFLRSSDLQVETCDFSDDFPDEENERGLDLSPGLKAYSHVPNQSVNSQLNALLVISLAAVAGLALGNYLGWSPAPDLSTHYQLMKLKQLQEELSTCKEHQVDGMNSSCFISTPVTRCDSLTSSSILVTNTVNNLPSAPLQPQPSAALSGYVQGTPSEKVASENSLILNPENSLILNPKNSLILNPETFQKTQTEGLKGAEMRRSSKHSKNEDIIIETRKYFPLSSEESSEFREKSGVTVWLLVSAKGVSRPLFTTGLRRQQQVKDSHLNPFIQTHFAQSQYRIWSEESGVSLLKADHSVTNLAKRTEVEKEAQDGAAARFWARITKKVYRKGRKFGSKLELEETITDVLLMLREEYFTHLWSGFQKKVAKLRGKKK